MTESISEITQVERVVVSVCRGVACHGRPGGLVHGEIGVVRTQSAQIHAEILREAGEVTGESCGCQQRPDWGEACWGTDNGAWWARVGAKRHGRLLVGSIAGWVRAKLGGRQERVQEIKGQAGRVRRIFQLELHRDCPNH